MHLIAARPARRSRSRCRAPRPAAFRRASTVSISSSPSPGASPGGPSMPSGSAMRAAQHLIAAADAEDLAAAPRDAPGCRCPSLRARSEARSASVAFDPGNITRSHRAAAARPARRASSRHAGLGAQRIEIVEIGDVRQDAARRCVSAPRVRLRAGSRERHAVFGRQIAQRQRTMARRRSSAQPGARAQIASASPRTSARSPRNLLTM